MTGGDYVVGRPAQKPTCRPPLPHVSPNHAQVNSATGGGRDIFGGKDTNTENVPPSPDRHANLKKRNELLHILYFSVLIFPPK